MSRSTKTILALAGVFLVWLLATGLMVGLLQLDTTGRWILRGALALIGVAAIAAWVWMRPAAAPVTASEVDTPSPQLTFREEIDALVRAAERKLASGRTRAGIGELPLFYVIGESGSAKTSTILHSGIDAELLAGQVFQGDSLSATRALNLWISGGSLFAEIAGAFTSSAEACAYIVRRLQPRRAGAVFAGKAQAPRAALVCVSCETFVRDGAAQLGPALARLLLSRLTELSQSLGIQLPVYVLFTKADFIPYFRGFMRNLKKEETEQAFGAALVPFAENAGVYAEAQGLRIGTAFDAMFYRAAASRAEHLEREQNPALLPAVYEFPREFRKLKPVLTQFLVDVCRPRQIGTSPFLRGFYFSGVRHVVEGDDGGQHRDLMPNTGDVKATEFFSPHESSPASVSSARAISFNTRRVPQWLFLTHLFSGTLLGDRAAQHTSAASVKSNLWRQLLLASAGLLASLFAIAFIVSWRGNARLEHRAMDAAQGLAAARDPVPSLVSLQQLDDLRKEVVELNGYRAAGPPAELRWGLYHGAQMLPDVRSTYFSHFQRLLLAPTQAAILARLRRLPPAPASSETCQVTFDEFKGYLMTTENPDRTTRSFLAPLLAEYWPPYKDLDDERKRLADSQFGFYSDELHIANPLPHKGDAPTVSYARSYLNKCDAEDRQYSALVAGISTETVSFNDPARAVTNSYKVSGRYTADAWAQVQARLGKPPSNNDLWVFGPAAAAFRGSNAASLSARYRKEYIAEWRAYLRAGSVTRYHDLRDAAKKLIILSGPKSPLLGMLQLASKHTGVDKDLAAEFRAAQSVVPAASPDLVSDPNRPYVIGLGNLQLAVATGAAEEPVFSDASLRPIKDAQNTAKEQVNPLKLAFGSDPAGDAVEKFLTEPISHVDDVIPDAGEDKKKAITTGLNKLRLTLAPLLSKYPFNRDSKTDATLAEFDAAFAPATGAIWVFQTKTLADVVVRDDHGQWKSPSPEKKPQANPGLLVFLNDAQRIAEAFYPSGAPPAHFNYTLRPKLHPVYQDWLVELEADGKKQTWGKETRLQSAFVWPAAKGMAPGGALRLGQTVPNLLYSEGGLWGIFKVMDYAEDRQLQAKFVQWKYTGQGRHEAIQPAPIDMELLDLPAGIDVFNRDFLGKFREHVPSKAVQ